MWLLDQWAERHISDAQRKGEFDNLAGRGEPLVLDDDSHVALNYGPDIAYSKMPVVYHRNWSSVKRPCNWLTC